MIQLAVTNRGAPHHVPQQVWVHGGPGEEACEGGNNGRVQVPGVLPVLLLCLVLDVVTEPHHCRLQVQVVWATEKERRRETLAGREGRRETLTRRERRRETLAHSPQSVCIYKYM